MGQAKRSATVLLNINSAAERVSAALRRLAEAASDSLGRDCYLHAALGQELMRDLGHESKLQVGYAAWRVGPGDGDVISHTPHTQGYLPEGVQGFAYHAWLLIEGYALDFTTYQLRRKARELDEADGGSTQVLWAPEYLLVSKHRLKSYLEVANAAGPEAVYYEHRSELAEKMKGAFELAPEDLATARILLANKDITVVGPNQMKSSS